MTNYQHQRNKLAFSKSSAKAESSQRDTETKTERIREKIIQKYPELYFGTVYRTREEKKWLMLWIMKKNLKDFTIEEMKRELEKFDCNLRETEINLLFKELELQKRVIAEKRENWHFKLNTIVIGGD